MRAWVLSVVSIRGRSCNGYSAQQLQPRIPQLFVEAIARITVTGGRADTAAFVTSIGQHWVQIETGEDGTVYVSNIRPVEVPVDNVLCLVEDKGLAARLGWQRTLLHEVSDSLCGVCAWESAPVIEAKFSKARCTTSYGHDLSPVTRTKGSAQSEREVRWWYCLCSRFRPWEVHAVATLTSRFALGGHPADPPRCW